MHDPLAELRCATTRGRMTPKHTLPSSVRAIVTCHGVPVARLFVKVRVGASFKNDFWSAFGPADSDGSISFSRGDLLRNGELDRSVFVMDYGHPEIDYTGHMGSSPSQVARARSSASPPRHERASCPRRGRGRRPRTSATRAIVHDTDRGSLTHGRSLAADPLDGASGARWCHP